MPKHSKNKSKILRFESFFLQTKKWDNEKLIILRKMLKEDGSLVKANPSFQTGNRLISGPPLFAAALKYKNCDLIQELLSYGADINAQCGPGFDTILHFAVQSIHDITDVRLIEFLLKNGADVNKKNKNWETPLHKLVRCWRNKYPFQLDVLRKLLLNGVMVDAENIKGYSAIYYVFMAPSSYLEMMRMLLNSGAHYDIGRMYNILQPFNRQESLQCSPCRVYHGVYCSCNYKQMNIMQLLLSYKIICSPRLQMSSSDPSSLLANIPNASHIVDFKFCETILEDIVWNNYCNSIIQDLCQMSVDRCTQQYTLLEFVQQSVTEKPVIASSTLIYEVSCRLAANKYPSCRDTLFAAINHEDLIHLEFLISLNTTDTKESIVLNSNCVSAVMKYLSKEDIINLLFASDRFEKLSPQL